MLKNSHRQTKEVFELRGNGDEFTTKEVKGLVKLKRDCGIKVKRSRDTLNPFHRLLSVRLSVFSFDKNY